MRSTRLALTLLACAFLGTAAASAGLKFYAVDDKGQDDSQLVLVDVAANTVTELGPTYTNFDIEGIDIDPGSGTIYAVGGEGNRPNDEKIYTWGRDGTLTEILDVSTQLNDDLVAAAFDANGLFWLSTEDNGLWSLDISTLTLTQQVTAVDLGNAAGAEAMAWSPDGNTLYLGLDNALFSYASSTVSLLSNQLDSEIEGLAFDLGGNLLGSRSGNVFAIDLTTYDTTNVFTANGRDFESLAVIPAPGAALLSLVGCGLIASFRRRLA